jgi:hypothetical protein
MLIRIRRRDNAWQETEDSEPESIIAVSLVVSMGRYMD